MGSSGCWIYRSSRLDKETNAGLGIWSSPWLVNGVLVIRLHIASVGSCHRANNFQRQPSVFPVPNNEVRWRKHSRRRKRFHAPGLGTPGPMTHLGPILYPAPQSYGNRRPRFRLVNLSGPVVEDQIQIAIAIKIRMTGPRRPRRSPSLALVLKGQVPLRITTFWWGLGHSLNRSSSLLPAVS